MRKIFTLLILIMTTLALLCQSVEAKRFGGGRSFGASRSSVASQHSYSSPPPASAAAAAPSGSTFGKWAGPLAGLAAGGLLASLFMGHGGGFGGNIGIILLALIAGMFILKFLNRSRAAPINPLNNNISNMDNMSSRSNVSNIPLTNINNTPINNTQRYDSATPSQTVSDETILREAKVQFIRLQAAYDKKDLDDLRQFTSPEVFGEIQLQLQERGDQPNVTEVVTLNALLLNTTNTGSARLIEVEFSGLIRENPAEEPHSFTEIWFLRKEVQHTVWTVIGVQQEK